MPTKTKKTFNLKSYVVGVLRRASYRNPQRTIVMRRANIKRGVYQCEACERITERKGVAVDHVDPVIPVTGWEGWDSFISRLFCGPAGLQVLCNPCHKDKTKEENAQRRAYAKEAKQK